MNPVTFAAPVNTLRAGDIYQGSPQYASPVQETTNQGTEAVEEKSVKSRSKEPVGDVQPSGFELPVLVAMFVAAMVLVRYY